MVNRWRRTASLSVEALSLLSLEVQAERRKQAQLQLEHGEKEQQLARMWEDSKTIKSAISLLEQQALLSSASTP